MNNDYLSRYTDMASPMWGGVTLVMIVFAFVIRTHIPVALKNFLDKHSWWLSAIAFIWYFDSPNISEGMLLLLGLSGAASGFFMGLTFGSEDPIEKASPSVEAKKQNVDVIHPHAPVIEANRPAPIAVNITKPKSQLSSTNNFNENPNSGRWLPCSKCGQLTNVPANATRACSYCGANAPLISNGNKPSPPLPSSNILRQTANCPQWLPCSKCGQLTNIPANSAKACGYCGSSAPLISNVSTVPESLVIHGSERSSTNIVCANDVPTVKRWKRTSEGLVNIATDELIAEDRLIKMGSARKGYRVTRVISGVTWIPGEEVDENIVDGGVSN